MVSESAVLVGSYAAPFMGVDTVKKADKDAQKGPLSTPWFVDFYSQSNFSFLGVYLQHPVPKEAKLLYISSSYDMERNWTQSWETLRKQGWGCFFLYVGYTEPRPMTVEQATKSGILHGQHVKTAIANFLSQDGADNSGSVVFLDTENKPIDQRLKLYFNSLFEELRTPGPDDCQPVRPGLYARDEEGAPNCSEMLDSNPDLFIWLLDHHWRARKEGANGEPLPIPRQMKEGAKDGTLYLEPSDFDIRIFQRKNIVSKRLITNIPVGIQGFLNYGPDEEDKRQSYRAMPTRALTKNLTPVTPWDFDMSFVRDPRYPEASPRVRAAGGVNNSVARGVHLKEEKRMEVHVSPFANGPILEGSVVEPDAPLLLPDDNTVITIDVEGNPIISTRESPTQTNPSKWSPLERVFFDELAPPLRRSRAIASTSLRDKSLHIYYIARDLSLRVLSRSDPKKNWEDPRPLFVSTPPLIHAFSNLACISQGSYMSLFTISHKGHLMQTNYTPPSTPNGTPLARNEFLEDNRTVPALLQGTALLAVSPFPGGQADQDPSIIINLIFGISRSLLLTLFSHNPAKESLPPITLGSPNTNKLFAHTRLAYNWIGPFLVQVAAISYTGSPVIYTISYRLDTNNWQMTAMLNVSLVRQGDVQVFPRNFTRPPTTPPTPLGERMADARMWSVNPFGDLNFGVDPAGSGEIVLMCAGSGPGNAVGVLYRRIRRPAEDWYLVR